MARGFTLVELLVVLAAIAVLLGIAAPFVAGGDQSAGLRHDAGALAAALRETRAQAIAEARETTLTLDLEARLFHREALPPVALEHSETIRFTAAASEVETRERARVRFFADGSATGGRVVLAGAERKIAVAVHWLTGRVEVSDDAGE